ncbi:uncharacterized protein PITG_01107 [Phytophthora infestans T30-4]|uniref:Uncharacterized protein n=1 Tax=Phytophthora infestans (strain T30-4) TaxID=403677 RepID=D0MSH1_PHYIT|nr:uncharacterized protein PITG_01107 [Phytophthora infestans T30-4]EEY58440.1 conserved hypothetical protein [Phytophthora infestans T30-4]|eukprot:XP_002909626.1 conserved hypothetical protein [Phytophthora infestans T30-4]
MSPTMHVCRCFMPMHCSSTASSASTAALSVSPTRLRATMAPTFSQASGYYGRRDNPSILAAGHDDFDFDLADDWNGQDRDSTSRWRKSCPDKRHLPSASRWGSRLTSLSSSVVGAGSALTKQLNVGDSTRRAIDQLRKSMIEVSTRTDASLKASLPIRHRFSEADIDRFEDEPESEKAGGEDMEEKASAKFEARNLKVFKDIRFDDQATTETTYQVTRLAAWLAEFEANHHQKLLPASSTDIS